MFHACCRSILTVILLCLATGAMAQTVHYRKATNAVQLFMMAMTAPVEGPPSVNVNDADAETLREVVNGLSSEDARAIVEHRQENGPYRNLRDILRVEGVHPIAIRLHRHQIVF